MTFLQLSDSPNPPPVNPPEARTPSIHGFRSHQAGRDRSDHSHAMDGRGKPPSPAATAAASPGSPHISQGRPHSTLSGSRLRSPDEAESIRIDSVSLETEDGSPPDQQPIVAAEVVENAPLPVALALSNLDSSRFSPQEQSAVQSVQRSFAAAIAAAPSQDPDSPEYFDYWKSASYLHDEQLRITLGWVSFNKLSALAAQNSELTRHVTNP